MKKLALLIMLFFGVGLCQGYVLTFDDIGVVTDESKPVPDGYGELNWNNVFNNGTFYYTDARILYPDTGYENGIVSGDYVSFCTSYDTPGLGTITSSPFTFVGTYITAGWRDGLNVQVDGYLNDILVYTTSVIVDTTSPTWFNFNYVDIDELRFTAYGGTLHEGYPYDMAHFVIDNFTYVPEPATLLLFGLGMFGVRGLNV